MSLWRKTAGSCVFNKKLRCMFWILKIQWTSRLVCQGVMLARLLYVKILLRKMNAGFKALWVLRYKSSRLTLYSEHQESSLANYGQLWASGCTGKTTDFSSVFSWTKATFGPLYCVFFSVELFVYHMHLNNEPQVCLCTVWHIPANSISWISRCQWCIEILSKR